MLPPQPQFSLPTPKYLIFHGLSRPFLRRRLASSLSPSKVMYSIQSRISSGVPLPTLPAMYGSQPISSQRSRNSCVPKALVSTTWPQCMLSGVGPVGAGADAVAPVVVVGKAAAGPAEVRNVDRLEGVDDVGPHAAGVGDLRFFADPDAVVDAAAEVLGELAVEMAADRAAVAIRRGSTALASSGSAARDEAANSRTQPVAAVTTTASTKFRLQIMNRSPT